MAEQIWLTEAWECPIRRAISEVERPDSSEERTWNTGHHLG